MGFSSFFKRNKKDNFEGSHIEITSSVCDSCEKCAVACPNNVLQVINGKISVGNYQACKHCRVCVAICPNSCIVIN